MRKKTSARTFFLLFLYVLIMSCATGAPSVIKDLESPLLIESGGNPWDSDNAVVLGTVTLVLPANTYLTPGAAPDSWNISALDESLQGNLKILSLIPKPLPKDICSYAWRSLQADYTGYDKKDFSRIDGLRATTAVFLPKSGAASYGIIAVDAGYHMIIAELQSRTGDTKGLSRLMEAFFFGLKTSVHRRNFARVRGRLWFAPEETQWTWMSDYNDGFLLSNRNTVSDLVVGFTCSLSKAVPPGYIREGNPQNLTLFFDNDILKITRELFHDDGKNRCIIISSDEGSEGIAFTFFVPSEDIRSPEDILSSKEIKVLTSRLTGRVKAGSQ